MLADLYAKHLEQTQYTAEPITTHYITEAVKLYKNLGKLLRCKQDMQKAARAELNQMAHENEQETNVFTMPDGPAEPQALD